MQSLVKNLKIDTKLLLALKLFMTSTTDLRMHMQCVRIELSPKTARLHATNGVALATAKVEHEATLSDSYHAFNLPAEAVNLMKASEQYFIDVDCDRDQENAPAYYVYTVRNQKDHVIFSARQTKDDAAVYPNVRRIFPERIEEIAPALFDVKFLEPIVKAAKILKSHVLISTRGTTNATCVEFEGVDLFAMVMPMTKNKAGSKDIYASIPDWLHTTPADEDLSDLV